MISRISVEDRNLNSKYNHSKPVKKTESNPSFKAGLWDVALLGIQECEKNPMINVAVIDLLSAILPRTIVESMTNWFAGFEAFRRESSGLLVNCIIPGFITMGMAYLFNSFIMPKGSNLATCWADSSLIQKASDIYASAPVDDKLKNSYKEILGNVVGYNGKEKIIYKQNGLTENEIEIFANKLKEITNSDLKGLGFRKEVKKLSEEIGAKTHVFENITVGEGKGAVKATTLNTLLEDTIKYFREYGKVSNDISLAEYAKRGKKLVKAKSIAGLAIVLPLAASMQYINRKITEKISGVEGAPIYEDFGKEQNAEIRAKSKEGLLKQKLISVSSMIGVGLLSMMKKPTWNMFEFKGLFPTMDQARIISTTTFASRMLVADDKNELAEATGRDIATFCGLYFLGDYAAKATATAIQKSTGVTLLNETKELEKDANIFKRFKHWVKDTNIKSSEEVVSKTAQELKALGKTPTKEQEAIIAKELKRAVNLRSACQLANLGVSLVLLGLIVPIWTRSNTKKKHAEQLRQAEINISSQNNETEYPRVGIKTSSAA